MWRAPARQGLHRQRLPACWRVRCDGLGEQNRLVRGSRCRWRVRCRHGRHGGDLAWPGCVGYYGRCRRRRGRCVVQGGRTVRYRRSVHRFDDACGGQSSIVRCAGGSRGRVAMERSLGGLRHRLWYRARAAGGADGSATSTGTSGASACRRTPGAKGSGLHRLMWQMGRLQAWWSGLCQWIVQRRSHSGGMARASAPRPRSRSWVSPGA
jgi:hypothetical protein